NVWEWCQDFHGPYGVVRDGKATEDREVLGEVSNNNRFVHRSPGFENQGHEVRSAFRGNNPPELRYHTVGLRPARTLPFSSFDRYAAARPAALTAAGKGKDQPPQGDAATAKLRRQALDWLKAELAAWSRVQPPRVFIARNLWQWQQESDL